MENQYVNYNSLIITNRLHCIASTVKKCIMSEVEFIVAQTNNGYIVKDTGERVWGKLVVRITKKGELLWK